MDTGQRSKASGNTVWLVYAQVFFVISQAYNIPKHSKLFYLETIRSSTRCSGKGKVHQR